MKYTIEGIRQSFEVEGYKLLSKTYKNNKAKLDYECPKGHKHKISWSDWANRGCRCPYCNGRPIYNIEDIRKDFMAEGYTLLTRRYINNKQKLVYICPEGHKHTISYSSWLKGRRCYLCHGNIKKDIADVKIEIGLEGYKLLSSDYTGCQTPLMSLCPNGHEYTFTWDNWHSKGSRCPVCANNGTSQEELELIDFVSKYADVHTHDRSLCRPKEVDIVIPSKKLAIEYCGLYWHSELKGKDKEYHLDKLKYCQAKGYKLITVFSDEFKYKKAICKSRLLSYIDTSTFTRIYARKCKVAPIDAKTARQFCNENHLQGYGAGSSTKLGLYHNKDLVAVMTFSRPSIAKGYKKTKEGCWELHRFCSKLGTVVVGAASKLLRYFERNYYWTEIFSYADRRWSDGKVYERLDFELVGHTKPNYWYIKDQCYERINRFSLRKAANEPKHISEWELRKAQGYNRIWDCGNLKYVKHNMD